MASNCKQKYAIIAMQQIVDYNEIKGVHEMDIARLKMLRKKHNLTQVDIANQLGFNRQRYNFYETGRSEPDHDTLVKLAEMLETSTDYLLGHTDDPAPPAKERDILDEIKFAFWGHDDITDEMLDDVRRFALFVEQKEKEKEEAEKRKNEKAE